MLGIMKTATSDTPMQHLIAAAIEYGKVSMLPADYHDVRDVRDEYLAYWDESIAIWVSEIVKERKPEYFASRLPRRPRRVSEIILERKPE